MCPERRWSPGCDAIGENTSASVLLKLSKAEADGE